MKDRLDFEVIFIDDGSKDGTLDILRELCVRDERIHYISFSRNFGKEAGIYAGLCRAGGDYAVTMDVDLQDPPQLLPKMYEQVKEGRWDCAAARRVSRDGEPRFRSFLARQFYRIMRCVSGIEVADGARDYRMMRRSMVDAVLSLKEYSRFSKGIFGWVGFRTCWLDYENQERAAGETKWSLWKLFRYSVEGIVAFSTAPLSLAFFAGMFVLLTAVLTLLWQQSASRNLLPFIFLTVSSIQLFCMGVAGLYLSRIYLESKKRPIYLVREAK